MRFINWLRIPTILSNIIILGWLGFIIIAGNGKDIWIPILLFILFILNVIFLLKYEDKESISFIFLFFKRKKLEQLARIKELEEKTK